MYMNNTECKFKNICLYTYICICLCLFGLMFTYIHVYTCTYIYMYTYYGVADRVACSCMHVSGSFMVDPHSA